VRAERAPSAALTCIPTTAALAVLRACIWRSAALAGAVLDAAGGAQASRLMNSSAQARAAWRRAGALNKKAVRRQIRESDMSMFPNKVLRGCAAKACLYLAFVASFQGAGKASQASANHQRGLAAGKGF
jgi:hypothetical protein